MMHLIEFLKTPMAAPETPALKGMRMTILGCCALLLPLTLFLAPARAAFGIAAIGLELGLVLALALIVPIYIATKNQADDRHLDELIAAERAGE